MRHEFNPYFPAADVENSPITQSRWRGLPSLGTGFIAGTALQWVLFWTDTFDTEFPPMGGAVLGVITVLTYRYSFLRSHKALIAVGAITGNVNAFWCNKAPLIYWDIPRDFVTSWTFALTAFLVTLVCTLALVKMADWLGLIWHLLSNDP